MIDRWSTMAWLGAGVALSLLIGATLLLPHQAPIQGGAWVAVAGMAALFAAGLWPPIQRLMEPVGGVVATLIIGLLVASTGGADSNYQDLFVVVLTLDGAMRSRLRLAMDTVAVAMVAAAPLVYGRAGAGHTVDLVIHLGVWLGVALLARLVTRRLKEAHAGAARLSVALDGVQDAVTVIDPATRRYIYANDAAARLLDREPDDLISRTTEQLWLDATARPFETTETRGVRSEFEVEGTAGPRLIEVRTEPVELRSGGRLLVSVGRDVTSERQSDENARELAAVVEATDVAVVSGDLHGLVRTWNPAAERLFGYTAEQMIGHPVLQIVPADRAEEHRWFLDQMRSGKPASVETVRQHRDGHLVNVAATFSPIGDKSGRLHGIAALYRDISERQAYERAVADREQQLHIFGELAQGMVYRVQVQPELKVLYVNPAITRITGFTPEDYYNDPDLPRLRIWPDDLPFLELTRSTHPHASPGTVTYRFRRRDGTWLWLEDHYVPCHDEHGNLTVQGTVFDVSARHELEQARQAALEHERDAAEQLRRTVEMQRTFLQAISHELRTPLTVVLGAAKTLQARQAQLKAVQTQQLLDRLVGNAERLEGLLSDLLDLDRATRGVLQPHLKPTELTHLCRRAADRLDFDRQRLHLDLQDMYVTIDAAKVERILECLLHNAVKHTPAGTSITLRTRREAKHIIITVDDDGPGVPPEMQDRLFDPFSQGPQATMDASPGTGTGLAIVAQFARLHGGEARYEPRPGGGSRFQVMLVGMGNDQGQSLNGRLAHLAEP